MENDSLQGVVKLRERVSKVEWQMESIGERLNKGAESFSDVRASIGDVRKDIKEAHEHFQAAVKPKPMPIWKILGMGFSILCVVATVIWMFARYPDRVEFKAVEDEIDVVKSRQIEMGAEQKLIKSSVDRQERTQEKIETKLNKLLEKRPDQPSRRRRRSP